MNIGDLIRSKPLLINYLLFTLLSLLVARIPLFNYLGYEFSAAFGLFAGTAIGLSTIALVRRHRSLEPRTSHTQSLSFFLSIVAVSVLSLAVPLVIISINALTVRNCSFVEGMAFFLLIPVVSVLYAVALGNFCAVTFRQSYLWYIIITLVTLLHPVYLGYFNPQLFSYNLLYGYFPGLSYDETLAVSWSLVASRLAALVLAGVLLIVSTTIVRHTQSDAAVVQRLLSLRHLFRDRIQLGFLSVSVVLLALFVVEREELRIETSNGFIRETLGSMRETRHFRIYYDSQSVEESRITWIAAEHEFRLQQVAHILNVRLPDKIDSYIYPSAELKRVLIGTGTTNITKPWLNEMHLNAEAVEQVLKHELVHILAAEFGIPLAGLSVSPGLMEGLAMAVEWDWGNRTLHEYSASMFKFGVVVDVSSVEPILTFGGFVQRPSTLSYVLAGSFIRYLIDRNGIDWFKRAYAWGNLSEMYRLSQQELLREWKQFLEGIDVQDDSEVAVQYLFLRPSIFQKECPRVLANLNREAWISFRNEDYEKAIALFQRSQDLSRNPSAIIGLVRSYNRTGDWGRAEEVASAALGEKLLVPSLARLRLFLGDAYWATEQHNKAENQYGQLLRMNLSDFSNETAQVRLLSLADTELRSSIREIFISNISDSARVDALELLRETHPHSGLISFLLGRALYRRSEFSRSQQELTPMSESSLPPFLRYLSAYTQGLNHFYLGQFQQAKAHFWNSLNFSRSMYHQNKVDEWISRCDWMSEFVESNLESQ